MKNASIVDVLIENIKTDQALLSETDTKIENAKEEKRTIVNRLKDYHKDVSVLLKYADDSKKKELETVLREKKCTNCILCVEDIKLKYSANADTAQLSA